jgi:hypothetical protein
MRGMYRPEAAKTQWTATSQEESRDNGQYAIMTLIISTVTIMLSKRHCSRDKVTSFGGLKNGVVALTELATDTRLCWQLALTIKWC